jgi:uncharacterized protein YaiL (DUF2058 family)
MGCFASKSAKVSGQTDNKNGKKPTTGKSRLLAVEAKLSKPETLEKTNSTSAREAAAKAAEERYKANVDKQKESSERLKAMKLMSKAEKGFN